MIIFQFPLKIYMNINPMQGLFWMSTHFKIQVNRQKEKCLSIKPTVINEEFTDICQEVCTIPIMLIVKIFILLINC